MASARFASGTIFSVDARMTEANCDTLQCPLLTPCVHRDSHGRARAKSSKQQVVRRWAAVCSAHRCRFVADELMRAGDDFLGKTGRCTSYDDNAFPLLAMHKPLVLSAPRSRAAAYANASDALRASASTIITHRRVMRGPQNDTPTSIASRRTGVVSLMPTAGSTTPSTSPHTPERSRVRPSQGSGFSPTSLASSARIRSTSGFCEGSGSERRAR